MVETAADDLFRDIKEHSVTEFFQKNRQMLGYTGKVKSLTTMIHELVTNSFDACEEAGILPEVRVKIQQLGEEHYKIIEEDNGPGIPKKHVPRVFAKMLAGTKFHRYIQLRGQQGIGVAGVTLFSQLTTGKPIKIETGTGNKRYEAVLSVDVKRNTANILREREEVSSYRGTRVELEVKNVVFNMGVQGSFEYLKRTAIANPHAKIVFIDPTGGVTVFPRVVNKVAKLPKPIKPHPRGIEVHDLMEMAESTSARSIKGMLITELARVTTDKVKELEVLTGIDVEKSPKTLIWSEGEDIIQAFKRMKFMAPPADGISPIGETAIIKALKSIVKPEFVRTYTKPPAVYRGGVPFQVEVGLAYGGEAGRPTQEGRTAEIMRFANRAPLLFDAGGCTLRKAITSVEWRRYGARDFENLPITIFVNIVSPHVPYTSTGKQAVAEDEDIIIEVRNAIMFLGRQLKTYFSRKHRASMEKERMDIFETYLPLVAKDAAELAEVKSVPDITPLVGKLVKESLIEVNSGEVVNAEEEE